MQLLSRADLLQMDPEALLATAECHGLDGLDELSGPEVLEALDELLDGFRAMAGED